MNLYQHILRALAFSRATFGPGARTKGVVDHIRKELVEIEESNGDLENADVEQASEALAATLVDPNESVVVVLAEPMSDKDAEAEEYDDNFRYVVAAFVMAIITAIVINGIVFL